MGWQHDWFFTILSLTCSISAILMQTGVCILSSFLLSSSTSLSVLLMTSSKFIKSYWFDKLLPLFLVGGLIHSLQYKGIMHSKCALNGSNNPPNIYNVVDVSKSNWCSHCFFLNYSAANVKKLTCTQTGWPVFSVLLPQLPGHFNLRHAGSITPSAHHAVDAHPEVNT